MDPTGEHTNFLDSRPAGVSEKLHVMKLVPAYQHRVYLKCDTEWQLAGSAEVIVIDKGNHRWVCC